jgi:hypothetical protein
MDTMRHAAGDFASTNVLMRSSSACCSGPFPLARKVATSTEEDFPPDARFGSCTTERWPDSFLHSDQVSPLALWYRSICGMESSDQRLSHTRMEGPLALGVAPWRTTFPDALKRLRGKCNARARDLFRVVVPRALLFRRSRVPGTGIERAAFRSHEAARARGQKDESAADCATACMDVLCPDESTPHCRRRPTLPKGRTAFSSGAPRRRKQTTRKQPRQEFLRRQPRFPAAPQCSSTSDTPKSVNARSLHAGAENGCADRCALSPRGRGQLRVCNENEWVRGHGPDGPSPLTQPSC